jgi:hypothetical protein
MRHLFKLSEERACGDVIIPPDLVKRWKRQVETKYGDLPEEEKESDRAEADKMIRIAARWPGALGKWMEENPF